jgi:hypothetical protein
MKIVSANVTGSFILNGVDLTTTVESSSIWSGSIASRVSNLEQFSSSLDSTYATDVQLNAVTQSVNTLSSSFLSYTSSTDDKIAQLYSSTASINNATASLYTATASLNAATASLYATTASLNNYTSSNTMNIANLFATSASLNAAVADIRNTTASLFAATASIYNTTSSLNAYTASATLRINALDQYTASLNTRSASFACVTATNNFACTQYFSNTSNAVGFSSTGSLYSDGGMRITKDMYVSGTAFFNNVTVFGTQSVAYISSSQLNIGTNIISVNTDTPSIRFGGLAVYDSGSTGLTGSILWDSQDNQWIYSNPSGSEYDSAVFLVGPRNSGVLGNEPGISCNFLSKGNGLHHMTSSGIFEDGSRTCFYGNTIISSSGTVCTTMANASCIGINTTTPFKRLTIDASEVSSDGIAVRGNSSPAYILCETSGVGSTFTNDSAAGYIGTITNHPFNVRSNSQNRLTFSSTGIACFACQVCAPIIVGSTSICSPQINATTSLTATTAFIQPNIASGLQGLYLQNNNTDGFGISLGLGLYGYTTGAYFNTLRIESSYPAFGRTLFWTKAQSNSAEVLALNLDGTGVATFSSCIIANGGVRTTGANGFSDTDGTSTIWMSSNWTSSRPAIAVTTNHPLMFLTNNTERVRIANTGVTCFACQVYIGTNKICWTDSTFKTLQVGNSAFNNIDNQTQIVNNIYFDGTNYRSLMAGASNRFIMATDGNYFFEYATSPGEGCAISLCSRMFICGANGDVGIGTTSPVTSLHIVRSTNVGLRLNATAANGSAELDLLSNGTQNAFIDYGPNQLRFRSTNSDMSAITNGSVLVLQNDGNVGIGTSNPSQKLQVIGIIDSRAADNGARFEANDTNVGGANITINAAFSGAGTPAIQTQTNHPIIFAPNSTERMRITSGGNVCIVNTLTIGTGCAAFGRPLTAFSDIVTYFSAQENITMGISAGTGRQSWGIQVCDTGDGNNALHLNARGGFVGINKGVGNVAEYSLDVTGEIRTTSNMLVGGNVSATGNISGGNLSGTLLTSTTQRLSNSTGNFANMVQKVYGAAGAFSCLIICVNLNGAGGWGYIINSGGTSGGQFQSGGGYINGPSNFSHSAPVGSGFVVTCHTCAGTNDMVRFVGVGGVHPFVSIQMFGSLNQFINDDSIYIDYRN